MQGRSETRASPKAGWPALRRMPQEGRHPRVRRSRTIPFLTVWVGFALCAIFSSHVAWPAPRVRPSPHCRGGRTPPAPQPRATGLPVSPSESPVLRATAWPAADVLFHRDPYWRGADCASSVDLGHDRVLWLFGDTFIVPHNDRARVTPAATRTVPANQHGSLPRKIDRESPSARRGKACKRRLDALIVRNSVAIERGDNPSRAAIRFYWRTRGGRPSAFFPPPSANPARGRKAQGPTARRHADRGRVRWYWPGTGIRLGRVLLIFMLEVIPARGGLGFSLAGSRIVAVTDPDEPPPAWHFKNLTVPNLPRNLLLGTAGLLSYSGYLYAYTQLGSTQNAYVIRWPLRDARKGRLTHPEWYSRHGWTTRRGEAFLPVALFGHATTEFTVTRDPSRHRFIEIQSTGFGPATLTARTGARPEGPWSHAQAFYRPPESASAQAMVYAGKAHPELRGGDALILTYVASTLSFSSLLHDERLYYPRFVRVTLAPMRRRSARGVPVSALSR